MKTNLFGAPGLSLPLISPRSSLAIIGPNRPAPLTTPAQLSSHDVERREESLQDVFTGHLDHQDTWEMGPDFTLFERSKPNATLAVIDGFGGRTDPETGRLTPNHGEMVAALALQASSKGEENLLRVESVFGFARPWELMDAEHFGEQLDQGIVDRYARGAQRLSSTLDEIYQNHTSIRTVNQSQGLSGPSLSEDLLLTAQRSPEFAKHLGEELVQRPLSSYLPRTV